MSDSREGKEGMEISWIGSGNMFREIGHSIRVAIILSTGFVTGLSGNVSKVALHPRVWDAVAVTVRYSDRDLQVYLFNAATVRGSEIERRKGRGKDGHENPGFRPVGELF